MTDEWSVLQEINKSLTALRLEVASLRDDLERAGIVVGEFPNPRVQPMTWTPPMLVKLGDMLNILAQSTPVAGPETVDRTPPGQGRDVPTDPTKDGDNDVLNRNTDPDAGIDVNARDPWYHFDSDPTPKDGRDKARDPKPDAHRLPKTDDRNNVTPKPDGTLDSIT